MPRIQVDNASVEFIVHKYQKVSFKEYVVRGLFRRSINPQVRIRALSNINLTATEGDRIGVIGHNGAGKSTLLKMLAGIYPPTQGRCTVHGRVCSLFDITLGFEPDASGWENIVYRAYLQGETPATLRSKIDAIAAFSELGEFLSLPVRNYSAGMRMRLAFSIATATEPEILLIDEVLAVGDLAFQQKARARMRELMSSSRLMVLVSHDLNTIRETCNRVIWLRRGEVVMEGPSDPVVTAYVQAMAERTKHAVQAA
ncbi:MAG: ABC transporter ATP-binding protein [Gemmataceae bacterium]|nr:ABC transporter ATP-binding protein [Gemmataceae bacterium]